MNRKVEEVLCIAANNVLFSVRIEKEVFVVPSLNKTNGHMSYHEKQPVMYVHSFRVAFGTRNNNVCSWKTHTLIYTHSSPSPPNILIFASTKHFRSVPVAARIKVWVWRASLAGIVCSNSGGDMDVCLLCVLLSGTGICDGSIPFPEVSCRLCCIWVWSGTKINL
jgi:hypothetical protein